MMQWPTVKSRQVLAALLRIGWSVKRQAGTSHKVLSRPGWPDYVFAFHDRTEIGPHMLARIARHTGLTPDHLK
ncbi:MAG: type II toxin-antitoxin system HicA family toxin [Candidatus Latescibacterota bacterium]